MKKIDPLHFQTYEYEPKERSTDWFWAVGIIAAAMAVTSIIFNNVLFGIVVILAGFTLSLYAARPPEIIDIVIDEVGVRIHNKLYPYRTLESYWIEEHQRIPKLLIKSQKLLMPYIIVALNVDEAEAHEIDEHLSRHLPEVFHAESIFEKALERLGF
jgi:hypothetical protein